MTIPLKRRGVSFFDECSSKVVPVLAFITRTLFFTTGDVLKTIESVLRNDAFETPVYHCLKACCCGSTVSKKVSTVLGWRLTPVYHCLKACCCDSSIGKKVSTGLGNNRVMFKICKKILACVIQSNINGNYLFGGCLSQFTGNKKKGRAEGRGPGRCMETQ